MTTGRVGVGAGAGPPPSAGRTASPGPTGISTISRASTASPGFTGSVPGRDIWEASVEDRLARRFKRWSTPGGSTGGWWAENAGCQLVFTRLTVLGRSNPCNDVSRFAGWSLQHRGDDLQSPGLH